MLETPQITNTEARQAAVIHLTIPRAEIQKVMGPAIGEAIAAANAQGIGPAGPVFAHHLSMPSGVFDFEVGVPVSGAVSPAGRVIAGSLPGGRAARAVYQGNYDGLHTAWEEFAKWIESEGLRTRTDLWEVYVKGPESDPDPSSWRTELYKPLLD